MPLLVNGAGGSAADPILKGLGLTLAAAAESVDIATVTDAWIDTSAGFPGTNSVRSSLSPDPDTVFTAGINGSYNNTSGELNIGDTTGLSAGDALYLSHAAITSGIYRIESVESGTSVTIENDPFGGADRTNVVYQVAYVYDAVAGTAPVSSSGAGQINYWKFEGQDEFGLDGEGSDSFYVRDEPNGSAFIAIGGGNYTGNVLTDATPALNVLGGWANKGGVATIEIVSASGIEWGDGGTAERSLSSAESAGLSLTGGDGEKTATLRLRSLQGSSVSKDVAVSVTLDTTGPSIVVAVFAR